MSIVTIVGAGMMGSAMCMPLTDNGHQVRLVGTPLDHRIIAGIKDNGFHSTLKRQLPSTVMAYQIEDLDEALRGADVLINGVSSFGVDWFSDTVLPCIPDQVLPVLSVTKGLALQDEQIVTFPHLLQKRLPPGQTVAFGAIGGPCTSYELADRRHSVVTFCGDDMTVLARLKRLLQTPYYHVRLSTDVVGVECAVALKNAYALGVTLAKGLVEREEGIGCTEAYNPQAALFGQSVREMSRLVKILAGNEASAVVGVADLYVTIFGGRTRTLGTLLGRGLSFTEAMRELQGTTLESVVISTRIAQAIRAQAAKGVVDQDDFPLLLHVDEIITQGVPVAIPWGKFAE